MANSSDSCKTGETVVTEGEFLCLNCQQMGKTTIKTLEQGTIFPHCQTCGTQDATYRATGKPVGK